MTVQTFSGAWNIQESALSSAFSLLQQGKDPFPSFAGNQTPLPSVKGLYAGSMLQNQPLAGDLNGFFDWYIKYYLLDDTTGVAHLTIAGGMSRFGIWGWGNEDYAKLIKRCEANPLVRAIMIKMFTPGGTVDSTRMLAETVRDCTKIIIVHTAYCCSAGMYVASQADEIWLEPQASTVVGSIGVFYMYVNEKKALEQQGYTAEIIRAPGSEEKYKPNSIEDLDEVTRGKIVASLVEDRQEFIGFMRRGRSGKLTNEAVAFTGDIFSAKAGLKLGLADTIGSYDAATKRAIQLSKQL
jgi:ClpP class serine protease